MAAANHADEEEIEVCLKVIKTVQNVPLEVMRSDTIQELKTKFQSIAGVAAKHQELFFAGNHLKDHRSLANCNILDGSTLNMHVSSGQGMKVYVEMPMGKTIALNVKEGDTIQGIKAMIQDKQGIPPQWQTLIFCGEALTDTHTLAACNITTESTIHMILQGSDEMQILISFPEGEVTSVTVRSWYTIWDVKTIIKSKTSTPQRRQKLIYDGNQLEDRLTLADYNIHYRAILQLSYLMQSLPIRILIVSQDGKQMRLNVHSCDDVYNLKKAIAEEKGIPPDQQRLIFEGRQLEDSKTLGDYDFQKDSTVHLVLRLRGS